MTLLGPEQRGEMCSFVPPVLANQGRSHLCPLPAGVMGLPTCSLEASHALKSSCGTGHTFVPAAGMRVTPSAHPRGLLAPQLGTFPF